MLIINLLQLLVPLAVIIWIALFGAHNLFSFCCEVLAVFVLLITLLFTGIWLVTPWWTPYILAGLTLPALLLRLRRRPRFDAALPSSAKSWLRPVAFLVATTICLSQFIPALSGRVPPPGVIQLEYPLESGSYLIVNGGNHSTINNHFLTLNEAEIRFEQWRGQSYALDIVKINNWGFRSTGVMPKEPDSYFIYGSEVKSPCQGVVKKVVNDVMDNQVPQTNRDSMSGNHVIISCKGIEVLLAHLIPNSIPVSENSRVDTGDRLGSVGNSGNSGEPHLHIHVQAPATAGEAFNTDPLPLIIAGQYWVRNQIMVVPL